MHTITVELGPRSYPVLVGEALLPSLPVWLRRLDLTPPFLLVSEPRVRALFGAAAVESLAAAGIAATLAEMPEGEPAKSLENVTALLDQMIAAALPRHTTLLALGGGALGDAAGFAAAVYHRGIAHVLVPTTVLAQADASIGGKVAINRGPAKNVVGAFHQPRLVLSDTRVLATLPEPEFRSGLAEIVKHGVIADPSLFAFLENEAGALLARDPAVLAEAIAASVAVKARVVAEDETDRGARAALNFGHTIGHALESADAFQGRRHGDAVSVGMAAACRLSVRLGLLEPSACARVEALLARFGLPTRAPEVSADDVLARLAYDKKGEGGEPRFVLTGGIGDVRLGARIPRRLLEEVARDTFRQAGA